MNQQNIGKFIAKKRKEQNLTQEQLAEKLNVSNKTISKWENGKCMPDYSIIEDLCKELNISIPELMDGEELEKSIRLYDEEETIDLVKDVQNLKFIVLSLFKAGFFVIFALIFMIFSDFSDYNVVKGISSTLAAFCAVSLLIESRRVKKHYEAQNS